VFASGTQQRLSDKAEQPVLSPRRPSVGAYPL